MGFHVVNAHVLLEANRRIEEENEKMKKDEQKKDQEEASTETEIAICAFQKWITKGSH